MKVRKFRRAWIILGTPNNVADLFYCLSQTIRRTAYLSNTPTTFNPTVKYWYQIGFVLFSFEFINLLLFIDLTITKGRDKCFSATFWWFFWGICWTILSHNILATEIMWLTPLDYFLWGFVLTQVHKKKMDDIIGFISDIVPQLCRNVIENFNCKRTSFGRQYLS